MRSEFQLTESLDCLTNPARNPLQEAALAAFRSSIETPINGIGQLANKAAGTQIVPEIQVYKPGSEPEPYSALWHAHQVGTAAGMLLPFALTHKTTSKSLVWSI